MADEMGKPPYNKAVDFPRIKDTEGKEVPGGELCNLETLSKKRGVELKACRAAPDWEPAEKLL